MSDASVDEVYEPLLASGGDVVDVTGNISDDATCRNGATTEVCIEEAPAVETGSTIDGLLQAEQRHNTRRHLWRAQVHALLGPEPPYAVQPEDRAGCLFGRLYYTWVGPLISRAARGATLTPEDIPRPARDARAFNSGLRLLTALEEQKFRRHGWDEFAAEGHGAALVRHRRDSASVGLLRWVGPVQQLRRPQEVYAGVEWKVPPKHRVKERKRNTRKHKKRRGRRGEGEGDVMPFHNGVIYGEHLFTTSNGEATATCEYVCDIVFMPRIEAPLPPQQQSQKEHGVRAEPSRRAFCSEDFKHGVNMPITSQIPPASISVAGALFSTFGSSVYVLFPIHFLRDSCRLAEPVVLQMYIEYMQMRVSRLANGVPLVAAFCIISILQSVAANKLTQMARRAGLKFQSALLTALFTKCATVARKGLAHPDMSAGRIVNMVTNDVGNARSLPSLLPVMIGSPLQLVVGSYLLYRLVGLSALAGLGVILIFFPLQGLLMRCFFGLLNKVARLKDERLKATNELLSGIRVVKYMSWEPSLICAIEGKRREELKALRSIQLMYILVAFISSAVPSLVVAAVFILFHATGNELTPNIVFPAIALFRLIQMPFIMIPVSISVFSRFIVSMRRISAFMECDDVEKGLLEMERQDSGSKQWESEQYQLGWSLVGGDSAAVIEFMNAAVSTYTAHKLPPCAGELWRSRRKGSPSGGSGGAAADAGVEGEGTDAGDGSPLNNANGGGVHSHGHTHGCQHGGDGTVADDDYYELQRKEILHDITLRIPRGGLTCVVGETGCGKSTLIESLLPDGYEITRGSVKAPATVAYVPQKPWVMNATLRENIIFFRKMDEIRLQRVLRCTQLVSDLELFPYGVETEIGENGVNLSGGQRARVGLARAVYAGCDVYLLDDPLSALDVHVGERVLYQCLLGELGGTTRVLATHQLHVLRHADLIVVLGGGGTVTFTGNYEEYKVFAGDVDGAVRREGEGVGGGDTVTGGCDGTANGVHSVSDNDARSDRDEDECAAPATEPQPQHGTEEERYKKSTHGDESVPCGVETAIIEDYWGSSGTEPSVSGERSDKQQISKKPCVEKGKTAGQLMTDEEVATGSVSCATYKKYAAACGGTTTCVTVIILFVLTEAVVVSPFLWLSFFSMKTFDLPVNTYLFVYAGLVAASVLCSPVRWTTGYGVFRTGSYRLHKWLLRSVVAAPISFFDTTPLGRVVNRFSKDMEDIDDNIPDSIVYFMQCALTVISSVAVMLASQYFIAVAIVPCGLVYYMLTVFYNNANRELRRVTNRVNSPVVSVLGEMLVGRSCMDAFGKTSNFLAEALRRVDVASACSYVEVVCNCWLSVRIDLLVTVVLTSIAGLGVFLLHQFGTVDVGLLSLSLTMAVNISTMLTTMVNLSASVEANMNSVERVLHYSTNIEHEDLLEDIEEAIKEQESLSRAGVKDAGSKAKKGNESSTENRIDETDDKNEHDNEYIAVPRSSLHLLRGDDRDTSFNMDSSPKFLHYTTSPAVEFCDVSMRYRKDQPVVLRNLSFKISAGQKVGVIGRTGSGKSSLLLALLRMVDIEAGDILIEGHPIRSYRLRKLRQLFSVIPQDPVLFNGSLRDNLDPLHTSSDAEIFEALRLVGMRERIATCSGGLESRVVEGGSNFSVGQRQLLCMARALLCHSCKFVLMDEATASIDPALDKEVQHAVRHVFAAHTVITVAHRLQTLAGYDLLLLLRDGRVVETGRPCDLLLDRASHFSRMVSAMGEESARAFAAAVEEGSRTREL